MKNGKCPKCGSRNVYTHDTGVSYVQGEIYIYLDGNVCEYDSYICRDCGYFENYIREKDIRGDNVFEKVAKEWDKVGW